MQPKSLLKETQQALANAIRLGNADPLNGYAANRLAVYTRLVRNNAFGFIDRCFVEAPLHIEPEYWKNAKENFVQNGNAHSPYFQDIAGEFLLFCQEKEIFDTNILALMDFENTQLLAEVSLAKVPEKFEWNRHSVMQLSGAAYLKVMTLIFYQVTLNNLMTRQFKLLYGVIVILVFSNKSFQS